MAIIGAKEKSTSLSLISIWFIKIELNWHSIWHLVCEKRSNAFAVLRLHKLKFVSCILPQKSDIPGCRSVYISIKKSKNEMVSLVFDNNSHNRVDFIIMNIQKTNSKWSCISIVLNLTFCCDQHVSVSSIDKFESIEWKSRLISFGRKRTVAETLLMHDFCFSLA